MSPSKIFVNPDHRPLTRTTFPPANPAIRAFHQSLPQYHPTPLISLPEIAKELGIGRVLLKDESTRLGLTAFKVLGASWATAQALLKRLNLAGEEVEEEEEKGEKARKTIGNDHEYDTSVAVSIQRLAPHAQKAELVLYAATDGNHGRAVARMARYLGIQARIFVPSMLDAEAKAKIVAEGAEVVVFAGDYDQTVVATKAAAGQHAGGKGLLISDTALEVGDDTAQWMVEGYQTMFDEVEEQVVELAGRSPAAAGGTTTSSTITHVLTPVGVGSLAQAVTTHFGRKEARGGEKPSIITVEPQSAACMQASLRAGKMVSVSAEYTICSGMCCGTLSASGWPMLKQGVTAAMTVDDGEVHSAVQELRRYGIHAGPCGAATTAALRQLALHGGELHRLGPDAVVLLLCTEGARGYEMEEKEANSA